MSLSDTQKQLAETYKSLVIDDMPAPPESFRQRNIDSLYDPFFYNMLSKELLVEDVESRADQSEPKWWVLSEDVHSYLYD